jgi:DNA-binding NarL/FixJ family response regulator
MNADLKTILFYQPGRYVHHTNAREADEYFKKNVPCNFLIAETWEDFLKYLNYKPELVGFHCELFDNESVGIDDLVRTVETITKLKGLNPKICLSIDNKTTQHTVNLLKKHKRVVGLQLSRLNWSMEEASNSWKQLLETDGYWPENIIRTLPDNKKSLSIYFRDDIDSYINNPMRAMMSIINSDFEFCSGWKELSAMLEKKPNQIFFHVDMVKKHGGSVSEFKMMLETLFKYTENDKIKLAVCINNDTPLATIKEFQKNGIMGIVPNFVDWGAEECSTAIIAIINNIPYWPKHILSQLPGNDVKKQFANQITLTARQQEVYNLIAERGLSNKQIARVLNIAESTVKIHVSAVMKSYCVRNRTQLALSAQK